MRSVLQVVPGCLLLVLHFLTQNCEKKEQKIWWAYEMVVFLQWFQK